MPRVRSSNFTPEEKTCLFTLVAKYKNVLENKKTDAHTNHEKANTWQKVKREFNSISPANINRTTEVLKRFYENKKKELRRKYAHTKMHARGTGGGPPLPGKEMLPSDDLLKLIVNDETVSRLNPPFGGDVDCNAEVTNDPDRVINNEVELVYHLPNMSGSSLYDMEAEEEEIPEIVAPSYGGTETLEENVDSKYSWESYTPSDLESKVSSPLQRRIKKGLFPSPPENIQGPSTTEPPRSTSHRRRVTVVKALTSDLAAKYDKLLDYRLEIAAATKKELDLRTQQLSEEHQRKMKLLDVQLEVEKERLKSFKRSNL